MNVKNLVNYLGIAFVGVLLFVSGFYFGYKYHQSQGGEELIVSDEEVLGVSEQITDTEIITKELVGAYWIKAGEEPVCPSDYPIKGKVDGSVGFFYTKTNKYYKTVKPVVCFATEAYASKEAGFIKKY